MTPLSPVHSRNPAFILNGRSVHVQEAQARIAHVSRKYGVSCNVIISQGGDDIATLAARLAREKHSPVVAGGGDGTVSAVAGKLAGTDIGLGVLPMGTLNHFAKDAGIPINLEAAVHNIFAGGIVSIDVGEVNGRVFVNNSGIGFYPHFVRQREAQERRGHPKPVAFLRALRSILRRYFRLRFKLHMTRDETLERVTPFLFVGNNRYETAGPAMGTRLRLDRGRLWICMAPRAPRPNILRAIIDAFLRGEADEVLNAFEAEEFWVAPKTKRVNVSTDGEVSVMQAPLHYIIRPGALRIVVPWAEAVANN